MDKVYLVGAGPGAPDLLTLRAARLLARADLVFYDALVHPDTLALATGAQCIAVGKRCGAHSTAQKFINKRLIDAARRGGVVVRLKGGDPMLFGRAHEEIAALTGAGIAVEVVPGITAALAASADMGVSLTRRGVSRSVVFLTPRVAEGAAASRWVDAARAADTVVFYMAAGEITSIAAMLIAAGQSAGTPIALVHGATWPGSVTRYATLAELAGGALDAPAGGQLPCVIAMGEIYQEALAASRTGADSVPADARRA